MQDLIERLEKATGPDRELGNDVLLASGWTIEEHGNGGPDTYLVWVPPDEADDFREGDHPDPTASIDAALTLVPEERRFNWTVEWDDEPGPFPATVWLTGYYDKGAKEEELDKSHEDVTGRGNTPAIALCIAALKARVPDAPENT